MGHICTSCTTKDSQIVQELASAVPNTGSPTFWNQTVYFTGGAYVQAYKSQPGFAFYSSYSGSGRWRGAYDRYRKQQCERNTLEPELLRRAVGKGCSNSESAIHG